MQGINRARHLQLTTAMQQLEKLATELDLDDKTISTLSAKQIELKESYQRYLKMLDQVAMHVAEYEDLFAEIRVRYTTSRIKNMKKIANPHAQLKS